LIEYSLIRVFLRKREFDSYYQYLSSVQNRELQKIFYALVELHKGGKEEYLVEDLELCFYGEYPALKPAEKDLYSILFKRIRETEADEALVEKYLVSHKESQLAHKTASLALEVYEGRKPFSELVGFTKDLEVGNPLTEEIELVTTSLTGLLEEEVMMPGFKWRLKCLNKSLGQLRKGALGHIFARVETGKTAMWVSELTYMVQQMEGDQVAAVFFNEEGGRDIVYRLYSAILRKPYKELLLDPKKAEEEFNDKGGWRIKFVDRPVLQRREVEKIIEQFNPSLVVVDNMDKVKGFENDRKDLVLADIYKWGREIAKGYAPVLSVGQADATAHNKKWLDEAQMADSKTGKPSELDFIIGIGRTEDEGMSYVRHINIPKNKLRGDDGTMEEYRHARWDVLIHPSLSIYEDILD
jgi:hypothetical protein